MVRAGVLLVALTAGCAERALDVTGETVSGTANSSSTNMLTINDASGGQHVARCSSGLPDDEHMSRALVLAWGRVLDMADAPTPTTTWRAGELGGDDVDADGHITVAWSGSFACTKGWVDGLLYYRRYLMTGHMGYGFSSGVVDQAAFDVDQAEGSNARAALADAGL